MSEIATQEIIAAAMPVRLNERVFLGYIGQCQTNDLARYAKAINACRFACEVEYNTDNSVSVYAARRTVRKS